MPRHRRKLSPRIYTAEEVADLLGISKPCVYESARAGRIPALYLGGKGGRVIFPKARIDALLERERGESAA